MNLRIGIVGLIFLGFVLESFSQRYYEEELLSTRMERKELRQKASVAEGAMCFFKGDLENMRIQ